MVSNEILKFYREKHIKKSKSLSLCCEQNQLLPYEHRDTHGGNIQQDVRSK